MPSRMAIRSLIPTVIIIAVLFLLYGNSLWQLLTQQSDSMWGAFFNDPYVAHILRLSIWQAFLSALISVVLGIFVGHAIFYRDFIGKALLLKLFSLSMVLPALVAIFGILGVYGISGWISSMMGAMGSDVRLNIYGLDGILLAHVFFNLPLATKIFLSALHAVPHQQRQLASQLGVIGVNFVHRVEWPYLRQHIASIFALVFMLCFTSFTIVLVLGGGPQYTTLEVAIYQALTFDFELSRAAQFALLQCIICVVLYIVCSFLSRPTPTAATVGSLYVVSLPRWMKWLQSLVIGGAFAFIGLPLASVVVSSMDVDAWSSSLQNPTLYRAIGFSVAIALCAGVLSIVLSVGIVLGSRQFHFLGRQHMAHALVSVGTMVLAVPTLVLAVGLFLLLRQWSMNTPVLFFIVVICNALLAMPFTLRIIAQPMYDNMSHYQRLCTSLGIRGWSRLRLIEWHHLRRPFRSAFALATALSLGDFTSIALFGNQDFTSLPRLLYQQLGQYRSSEANVTALILLIVCALIFMVVEKYNDTAR